MNRFAFVSILAIIIFSCSKTSKIEQRYVYYETGEISQVRDVCYEKDSVHLKYYYRNGNLSEECYSYVNKGKGVKCFGILKEYYPDGFPKDYMPLTDSGRSVLPKKEDVLKGYKIKVDVSPTIIQVKGLEYIPFRVYVEGVARIHYDVAIIDVSGNLLEPWKMEENKQKYRSFDEAGNFVEEFVLEEQLYPYMIALSSQFLHKKEDGSWQMKLGVFYPSLTRDTTIPQPHQVVSSDLVLIDDATGEKIDLPE